MTKIEMFTEIKGQLTDAEQIEFIENEIASLEAKAAKAKARTEAKKAEGDALRDRIFNLLGDEPKTLQDILAELDESELTTHKIVPRISQLIKSGAVEKEEMKTEGGKKMGYKVSSGNAAN